MLGTRAGTQTDLRMEATGTGDLPDFARNADGDGRRPSATPGTSTNKRPRSRQRARPPTVRHPGRRPGAGGDQENITDEAGRRGPIAGRIEKPSRPTPQHDGPRRPESHRQPRRGCRATSPLSPDGRSPIDVRRLWAGAPRGHRQNYVRRYVLCRAPNAQARAQVRPRGDRGAVILVSPGSMSTHAPRAPDMAGRLAGARQATR